MTEKEKGRGDYQVVIDFREKMGREPTPEEIFALGFGMVGGYEMGRTAGLAELSALKEEVAREAWEAARDESETVMDGRRLTRDAYESFESWWAQRKKGEGK